MCEGSSFEIVEVYKSLTQKGPDLYPETGALKN